MAVESFISALQICGLVSCLLCVFCVLFIFGHYFVFIKPMTIIEILSILSMTRFGMCGLSSALYFMFDECGLTIFHSTVYCNIWTFLWTISWRFAIVMLQILYIKRLQITFDHLARYRTPNRVYKLSYVLNVGFILSSFITGILYLTDEDPDIYDTYFAVDTIVSQILQFIISVGLIKLYIGRLFVLNEQAGLYLYSPAAAVGRESHDFYTNKDVEEDSGSTPELSAETAEYSEYETDLQKKRSSNPAQKKILGAISKMTVLSALAIISSETVFTFQAIGGAAGWFANNDEMMAIWYIGWDIDVVVNAICLFLSFDFNDNVYQKWCCGLHRCCMWTCDKCSRRKQARNANDLEQSLISLWNCTNKVRVKETSAEPSHASCAVLK